VLRHVGPSVAATLPPGDASRHLGYRPAVTEPTSSDPGAATGDVGRLIGERYRLEAIVGRGGMATIYRAHDERGGSRVAVKILRPEIASDRDLVERFRREALAASALHHPNIVACLDTGTDPAGPYLVMALVDGEDLTTRLRRETTLPPADVARIGLDIARALGVAHERGIVHRDVKPGNILLATDGRALITDFGIARIADDAEGSVPGTILGSVQYFSPEQARGDGTTPASDVYGLGLVLYESLTGLRPWSGETSAEIALARIGAPAPSPRAARIDVPVALDAVVMRAMDPDPSRRYPNGTAMATALERLLVAPAPRPRTGEAVMVAASRPEPPVPRREPARAPAVEPATVPRTAGQARQDRGRTPLPILAMLALAGVLVGAVAVAAFPGTGTGTLAIASDPPASTEPDPTSDPTPDATPTPSEAPIEPTPEPTPDPTPGETAPPVPAADLCEPIFGFPCGQDAGHYGPSRFVPAVTFDLGSGWSTELHGQDRVALDRPDGRLTLLGDVTRVYPKGSEVEATGSLRKVIDRIAATKGAKPSKVRGLTIDGRDGFSVDLTTRGDEILPILGMGEETVYLQPGATTRFVLLEAGDRTLVLVIEPAAGATLQDILATADDVAGSLDIR
jgi:hypothetical protein